MLQYSKYNLNLFFFFQAVTLFQFKMQILTCFCVLCFQRKFNLMFYFGEFIQSGPTCYMLVPIGAACGDR